MDKQAETQEAQSTEVIVEARNLSKTYRDFWGRSKKVALKPLDLEIRQGEIFGLLGPNGSGKTTTMKLLLGLIFPTSGEAVIFGKDATDVSKNDRIGYLPEESYLYKFLDNYCLSIFQRNLHHNVETGLKYCHLVLFFLLYLHKIVLYLDQRLHIRYS